MSSVSNMPDKDIRRSGLTLAHRNLMTMSSGNLYPIYLEETLPGDTFSLDVSTLARMSTPIHPVMDDCFLDIYFFHVPNRLTWEHWTQFIGEKPIDPYEEIEQYTIPQLKLPPNDREGPLGRKIAFKSLMDYFGLPAGQVVESFSALPFRAYGLIWNEWFRSEFLQNPINVDISDSDTYYWDGTPVTEDGYVDNVTNGGVLAPVNKFHDLFTSATIEPQNGEDVPIPLNGIAPVYAIQTFDLGGLSRDSLLDQSLGVEIGASHNSEIESQRISTVNGSQYVQTSNNPGASGAQLLNVVTDFSNSVPASIQAGLPYSTINDLRYSFAVQTLLEHDLYGTRYNELIKAHFGVDAPLGLLQKPEFLGHKRIPITMSQVLQTSSTDSTSPQGNASGFSMTKDYSSYFSKSFVEHGYVIGLACIRCKRSYSQGIDKMWSRKDRLDFYWPELANISNQPILNKEIYSSSVSRPGFPDQPSQTNNEVFGYSEAWYEYRNKLNKFCGEFRSNYPQSLDSWHYGEDFAERPYLSDEFLRENRNNIDRTLAVDSDEADQFICDFYFVNKCARPIPVYSVPGLRGFF